MKTQITAGPLLVLALLAGCDDGPGSVAEPDAMPVDMADRTDGGEPDAAPDAAEPDAMPDAAQAAEPPMGAVVQLAGDTSTGFADGEGAAARFNGITCVTLSADGDTLFASDTFNGTVRAIALDARSVTTLAGRPLEFASFDGGPGAARLTAPRGCAATADALFVADGPTLRRVDFDGTVSTLAGQANERGMVDGVGPEARLGYLLHDLEPDAEGQRLYISDRSNDRIRVIDLATREVSTFVGPEGGLNGPGGIQRVGETLYVADTFDGEIVAVDLTTGDVDVIADGLDAPQGLAVDRSSVWAAGFDGALYRVDLADGSVSVAVGVAGDNGLVDGDPPDARLGGAFAPPVIDEVRKQLYYVDIEAGGVRQIDTGLLTVAPLVGPEQPAGYRDGAEPRFGTLYDVVGDHAGGWLVSDPLNNAVRAIDGDGAGQTLFGVPGESEPADGAAADARIDAPVGLAWVEGRLYVADYARDAIRIFDPHTGEVSTAVDSGLSGPWGLGAGPDGSLWITEADRGAVRVLRPDGTMEEAAPAGRFENPADVAVDPADGAVYVADAVRAAIYRIEPDGRIVPVVGTPGQTGVRDGPLDEALLAEPTGLTFDDAGGLLVVDGSNHMIRRIDFSAGTMTRWLGHPTRHGGHAPGTRLAWSDATLERPQAVWSDGDGILAIVNEFALLVARPGEAP